MILSVLICCLCAVLVRGDLNSEVDEYLAKWYTGKMQLKVNLNDLTHRWTHGALMWKKNATLTCSEGTLDISEAVVRRSCNASVRGRAAADWVYACLSLSGSFQFQYGKCTLQDDTALSYGILSGTLTTSSNAVDLLFTYDTHFLFFCKVKTIKMFLREMAMNIDFNSPLLKDADSDVISNIKDNIVFTVANSVHRSFKGIISDGPNTSRNHC